MSAVRSCRLCGCTDNRACPGGCSWASERLCSACVPTIDETITSLSLVSGTEHITEEQVIGWNIDQRADAFNWAMSVHFNAGDNDDVVVPERPVFTVKAYLA